MTIGSWDPNVADDARLTTRGGDDVPCVLRVRRVLARYVEVVDERNPDCPLGHTLDRLTGARLGGFGSNRWSRAVVLTPALEQENKEIEARLWLAQMAQFELRHLSPAQLVHVHALVRNLRTQNSQQAQATSDQNHG